MPKCTVRFVETHDRQLLTLDLDVAAFLETGRIELPEAQGAVVRVRGVCTEAQSHALAEDGQRRLRSLVEALTSAGAFKIIGPQLTVERERRTRSELTVEVEPMTALESYLDLQQIDADLRPRVVNEARKVMR